MDAAFDRADGDGIGHQIRLETSLDYEQSTDLAEFRHRLSKRHETGAVPPFPD
jgi:hypothetical protein